MKLGIILLRFCTYGLLLEEIYECFIVLKNDVIAEQVKVLKRLMTLHLTMIVEQEESTKECHIKATSEQAQLVTLAYASDT